MRIKKKPIFEFTNLEGAKYKVYEKKFKGLDAAECDPPDTKYPKIFIDPSMGDKIRLRLWVEEIFHSMFFDITEKRARKLAYTLARALYGDGYRRIK